MSSARVPDIKAELTEDIRAFKAPDLAKRIMHHHLEKELVKHALDKEHLLSSRAMWVLGHCSDMDYKRITPFHDKLITNLKNKNLHNGVIRNTLRFFQEHDVPKKHEAFMLDTCYGYIQNPAEAIAVRAFAMRIVFNISTYYPELLQELEQVLLLLPITEESPGIRSRVKNTLKAITKSKKK